MSLKIIVYSLFSVNIFIYNLVSLKLREPARLLWYCAVTGDRREIIFSFPSYLCQLAFPSVPLRPSL